MTRTDACKAFLADLARPFAIYVTATAAAVSTVRLAFVGDDLSGAAVYIGAVFAGLAGLYGFRAWESRSAVNASAEVEKVRAAATPPPGTAQITAAPDVDVAVRQADDDDPTRFGGPRE
jgi:hypothetical protein